MMTFVVGLAALIVGLVGGWYANKSLGAKITAADVAVKQAADTLKKL